MTKIYSSMPSTPDIPGLTKKIQAVLESGVLTNNGPTVKRVEFNLSQQIGNGQGVSLVTNGTVALEMITRMPGAIFVPSYTFVASVLAPLRNKECQSRVFLIDVNRDGIVDGACIMNAEMALRESGLKYSHKRITVLGVDLFSQDCAYAMTGGSDRFPYPFVIDAAQSFGIRSKSKVTHPRSYSFHATKLCHSLEGGAVVGDNAMKPFVESIRNFGVGYGKPVFGATNAKMDEIRATILEHNIENMYKVLAHNRILIECVYDHLPLYKPYIQVPIFNDRYALLKIADAELRAKLLSKLEQNDIYLRNYFKPLHMMSQYSHLTIPGLSYEMSESLDSAFISLPLGLSVSCEMAEKTAIICMEVLG